MCLTPIMAALQDLKKFIRCWSGLARLSSKTTGNKRLLKAEFLISFILSPQEYTCRFMPDIKKIKPLLSKGTRDFLPEEVARRNYIFETIKKVLKKFGYQQIDTPAFERLETLTGKYGEEGDRLLFKILNSGDFLKDCPDDDLQSKNSAAITKYIADKGLRYDLTVPLARYVVQHNGELTFPFKRFHIGPVWRADRPQKGRYQEFYQCDADVIGSTSLLNEVELTQIYLEVFQMLGIYVIVRINHRKLIDAIISTLNLSSSKTEIISIIDKADKLGWEGETGLVQLLKNEGIRDLEIAYLKDCFFNRVLPEIILNGEGYREQLLLKSYIKSEKIDFDPSLMRGLDYYTGTIWEIVLDNSKVENKSITIGSLGGGGRYDNLTEIFGGRDLSGVGISFGIERIYDVMEELKLFPEHLAQTSRLLFVHFDEASEVYAFEQLQKVRAAGIPSEIYPGRKKLDKQMNYANDKKIPYVVVVGEDEMNSGLLNLKDMQTGLQEKLGIGEIISKLINA